MIVATIFTACAGLALAGRVGYLMGLAAFARSINRAMEQQA